MKINLVLVLTDNKGNPAQFSVQSTDMIDFDVCVAVGFHN